MGKKNSSQVQLEQRIRELERELEQIKRKLKRSLKQLSKYEDIDFNAVIEQENNEIKSFSKKDREKEEAEKREIDSYITVILPNGKEKKIKKRINQSVDKATQ